MSQPQAFEVGWRLTIVLKLIHFVKWRCAVLEFIFLVVILLFHHGASVEGFEVPVEIGLLFERLS